MYVGAKCEDGCINVLAECKGHWRLAKSVPVRRPTYVGPDSYPFYPAERCAKKMETRDARVLVCSLVANGLAVPQHGCMVLTATRGGEAGRAAACPINETDCMSVHVCVDVVVPSVDVLYMSMSMSMCMCACGSEGPRYGE